MSVQKKFVVVVFFVFPEQRLPTVSLCFLQLALFKKQPFDPFLHSLL